MLKSKPVVGLFLTVILIATLVPFSTQVYAQGSEGKRVEKFVELTERAGEKVGDLINLISANETALNAIDAQGLKDEFEGNITLFETGMESLSDARNALDAGDFENAVSKATEALGIFREVFKALNNVLAESNVTKGQLIDAQGLIEAMERALERIEKLREIAAPTVIPYSFGT